MNKAFMRNYYKNYYDDPQSEAVKDSEAYKTKRALRYSIEEELFESIGEKDMQLYERLEKYLDVYAEELEIVFEEMYLLGAMDRENMLKT